MFAKIILTIKSDVEEMFKLSAYLTIIHFNIEMFQELIISGGEGKVRASSNTNFILLIMIGHDLNEPSDKSY